jgi:hypothetical protein
MSLVMGMDLTETTAPGVIPLMTFRSLKDKTIRKIIFLY